ncbi:MAG: hypothetical protein QXI33_03185 [Candidatus Pacearchaeota archaeon]
MKKMLKKDKTKINLRNKVVLFTILLLFWIYFISLSSFFVGAASTGEQKIIAILVNFQDKNVSCSVSQSQNIIFTNSNSVNNFYRENSEGKTWFTGNVIGPYTINYSSTSSDCPYYSWAYAAESIATQNGINLSEYNRRMFILPSVSSCGFAGVANIGGPRSWVLSCSTTRIYSHELGHNLGMRHASTLTSEYGDNSDVMGNAYFQSNAPHKEQMTFIPSSKYITPVSSGVYTIASTESISSQTSLPQAIKIYKNSTIGYYYFSYRQPVGFDTGLSSTYKEKLNVHTYKGGSVKTFFIGSYNENSSFVDPEIGLSVRPINKTASTMDVYVNFNTTPCVNNAPTLTISPSSANGYQGSKLTYIATLKNNNLISCPQTNFILSVSPPLGWNGSVSPSSLNLGPGNSGSTSVYITSSPNSLEGAYTFSVSSSGSANVHNTSSSAVYNVLVDNIAPLAPTNLIATKTGKGNKQTVNLNWDAATDNIAVAQYLIYRNNVHLATISGNTLSYKDGSTKLRETYSYYVIAKDGAGNISPPSNTITITI